MSEISYSKEDADHIFGRTGFEINWQPIDTAPEIGPDNPGQWLLIFDPKHGVRTALHTCDRPEEWLSEESYSAGIEFNPTHWFPLPDPPYYDCD